MRAWLYGVGAFVAVTAAFCIALGLAIVGPPSASEVGGLKAAFARAAGKFGAATRQAGADPCSPSIVFDHGAPCAQDESAAERRRVGSAEPRSRQFADEVTVAPRSAPTTQSIEGSVARPLSQSSEMRDAGHIDEAQGESEGQFARQDDNDIDQEFQRLDDGVRLGFRDGSLSPRQARRFSRAIADLRQRLDAIGDDDERPDWRERQDIQRQLEQIDVAMHAARDDGYPATGY